MAMDRKVEKLKRVLGGSGSGARLIGEKDRVPSGGVMLSVGLGAGALNKHRVHIQLPDGRESLVRELKSAFGRGNVTVDVDVSSKPSLGAKSAG